jgi:hypothetical protein
MGSASSLRVYASVPTPLLPEDLHRPNGRFPVTSSKGSDHGPLRYDSNSILTGPQLQLRHGLARATSQIV